MWPFAWLTSAINTWIKVNKPITPTSSTWYVRDGRPQTLIPSRFNNKIHTFLSRTKDLTLGLDALIIAWSQFKRMYVFTPAQVLSLFLHKTLWFSAVALVCVPLLTQAAAGAISSWCCQSNLVRSQVMAWKQECTSAPIASSLLWDQTQKRKSIELQWGTPEEDVQGCSVQWYKSV